MPRPWDHEGGFLTQACLPSERVLFITAEWGRSTPGGGVTGIPQTPISVFLSAAGSVWAPPVTSVGVTLKTATSHSLDWPSLAFSKAVGLAESWLWPLFQLVNLGQLAEF